MYRALLFPPSVICLCSSVSRSFLDPFKVKSERGRKYALELIDLIVEREGLKLIERENESFVYPYEEDATLFEKELIKAIYSGKVGENDSIEKIDLSELFKNMAKEKAEEVVIEEPSVEAVAVNIGDDK